MNDIICECGHKASEHDLGFCFTEDCYCVKSEGDILRARIASLEAVAEAAIPFRVKYEIVPGGIMFNSPRPTMEQCDALDDTLRAAGYLKESEER